MAEVRPADLLELGALQRQVLTAIRFAARTAISVSPGVVRAVANHERPVIARERSGGVGAPDVEPGQSSRTRVELPMLCTDPSQFNGRRRVGPCSTSTFGELRQVGFTASPQQCCRLGRPAAKAGGKLPRRITDGPSQQIAKARNTVVPERYPGHVKDRDAAHRLLAALRGSFSTIGLVWADGGYPGRLLIWAKDVLTLYYADHQTHPRRHWFPLFPLFYETRTDDIVLVQINPLERRQTPRTAREIRNRLNEITFHSNLLRELRAVAFVQQLIEEGKLSPEDYKKVHLHRIDGSGVLDDYERAARMKAEWDFFVRLRDAGRRTARSWLEAHYGAIGSRSTLDLQGALP